MKFLALALAIVLAPVACAHIQPYVGPAVNCAMVNVAPYLGRVVMDLETGNFADLDALALDKGVDFVACVIKAYTSKTGAGAKSVENGNKWLDAHGVQFVS